MCPDDRHSLPIRVPINSMTLQSEDERELRASILSPRTLLFGIGIALIAYLCWRILLPFLPAVCWALALAIIAEPMRAWLSRKSVPPSVTAAIVVVLILAVVAGPGTLLATWNADQLCPGIRVVEAQRTVRMIDGLQLPEMLTWPASARLVGFQRF